MPALSEYTNVYNTAILILQNKGYQVWYDQRTDLYYAEKDGWDFASDSPCGLLGVVSIYEYKRPARYSEYWWREDGPDVYSKLPRKPKRYKSVLDKE